MVANTRIFHSGNSATQGHNPPPPPPKRGSGCWWRMGQVLRGQGSGGQSKGSGGRSSVSYPGCPSFSLWYTLTSPPFCTFQTCAYLIPLSALANADTHLCSSLWRSCPSTSQYVKISLELVQNLALALCLRPDPTAVSFFKNARE